MFTMPLKWHSIPFMNFPELIKELEDVGVKHRQMADHCNCKVGTISALKCGQNLSPRWSIGNGLIELHKIRCPDSQLLKKTG